MLSSEFHILAELNTENSIINC